MITTVSIFEMYQIINSEHKDPHTILGMHEVLFEGKEMVSVRVFAPCAKVVTVIDKKDKRKKYSSQKLHDDGFFEAVIENRKNWFSYILHIEYIDGNTSETEDMYAFNPTISEYDRYLFNAGNHYEIYNKLGAQPHRIDGVDGVAFAVWAPNAKSISVIGSFNYWDGRAAQMRMLGNSGIWELFIPGTAEYDRYKFRIKDRNNNVVDKTDPYGFYTEVRPMKASVVYDLGVYHWEDEKWIENRENTDEYRSPINIYEVHLGSWMRVPEENNRFLTYKELADKLVKYVKKMGYTHIELLPVTEYPFDGSWGYQVTGYYAPTSRFGEPDDFRYFIDCCHRNDIGIIIDWVPAHFPKDENGLARFDGTALYEHEDWRKGEHKEWGTYVFNYGRKEVSNFLIANALFWIKEFHIDGIRMDAVASMLYLDYCRKDGEWLPNEYGGRENLEAVEFLKHLNSAISSSFKGVMTFAEESTSWEGVTRGADSNGLGFTFKWNMGWMNDFLEYMKKEPIYRKYHHNNLTFGITYAFSENFVLVLSHDEVVHMKGSMINKMPGDKWQKFSNLRAAYGFMYTYPGKKLLFMGNDIAQYTEWSEERSIDWHLLKEDENLSLNMYLRDLFKLYKKEPALWEKDTYPEGFDWIECDDAANSVLSYVRYGKNTEELLLVVCNFTPRTVLDYNVGVPFEGFYKEILNSDDEKYGGSGIVNKKAVKSKKLHCNRCANSITINLPPLAATVFTLTQNSRNKLSSIIK
ncbi:MAG: 1,4-alpha-glucan branching protein GlgB [Candidatus Metalachnospira sp.]|nr:1,4-alpha-glucan branching protein GlgB [Candidatus Metalachnospira sp.]